MQIYVINLDRDPARFAETKEQFDAAGAGAMVRRVAAIDAQAPDFAAPGYAPHSLRDRWELKRSEQAVFESHRSVWKTIAGSEDDCGVVCEDDILVSAEFSQVLKSLDCNGFGVVKLDGFSADRRYGQKRDMNGWVVRDIVEPVPSAACYAVSRQAATQLLKDSKAYCATLDDFVFSARAGVNPVQLSPAVAVQRICCEPRVESSVQPQSVREQRDTAGTARGPLLYRLQKEIRRGLRHFGSGRQEKIRPALASDLPKYEA